MMTVTFTYGGGTGTRDSRGAEAQAEIDDATFIVESMGGGSDSDFLDIRHDCCAVADTVDPLTIEVMGAESGTGEVEVEIVGNKSGAGFYDGETDVDKKILQVHAGDDSTYIVFTYTPDQTIADGQLRFTVPGTWTAPQDDDTSDTGFTYFNPVGGAVITNEEYNQSIKSVTADISLTVEDQIEIHYGAEGGGAVAPGTAGSLPFAIAVKGTSDTADDPVGVDDPDLAVRVRAQRSGGGMAEASPMSVNAGDLMPEITVTYTADGQVDAMGCLN